MPLEDLINNNWFRYCCKDFVGEARFLRGCKMIDRLHSNRSWRWRAWARRSFRCLAESFRRLFPICDIFWNPKPWNTHNQREESLEGLFHNNRVCYCCWDSVCEARPRRSRPLADPIRDLKDCLVNSVTNYDTLFLRACLI